MRDWGTYIHEARNCIARPNGKYVRAHDDGYWNDNFLALLDV
jgi:hypothetical protein